MNNCGAVSAPKTESRLKTVTDQLDRETIRLEEVVSVLIERLSVVRCSRNLKGAEKPKEPETINSPVVTYIVSKTEQIRDIGTALKSLVDELEI